MLGSSYILGFEAIFIHYTIILKLF
jgi:hypothetical protein